MASNTGTASFTPSTGSKTINVGMTGISWMEVEFGSTTIRHSKGYIYGGNQFCYPDPNSDVVTGKAIQVKNNAGTVILEGTWTSFTGTSVNFNITTAASPMPVMLLTFGNT